VILSTSVAETSLTIDGVRVVIDAGLERRAGIERTTGAVRLETVMASQASATQRAGRAGRTAAGVCYRLWSQSEHSTRAISWQAEIMRAELSTVLLETVQWGASDINALPWLEPPPAASVARAEALLEILGIWRDGRLTEHGAAVARLPVHPRLGHMLVWAAEHGAADLACTLAVLLEDGTGGGNTADLDLHTRKALSELKDRRRRQLLKLLENKQQPDGEPGIGVLIAQAFPDWIARRRPGTDARYQLACGAGAFIASVDPLAQTQWLAIADMGGAASEARIFLACALDVGELESWVPELFSLRSKNEWDDRQERVVAEQQKCLGELIVEATVTTDLSPQNKALALLEGIRQRGIGCLPWTVQCRQWQARVQLMKNLRNRQDQEVNTAFEWPAVDDASLQSNLDEWLLVWLHGKSSLKALAQLNLFEALNAMLSYEQQQALKEMLPERYTVPSGSSIGLRYAAGETPVLSVKLQEMFGCVDNPAIANGQIILKVELLSPARRPVQLTADLANFWTTSYPQVKKEMAGRYPKHDWPADPIAAKPSAYAKPRKRR